MVDLFENSNIKHAKFSFRRRDEALVGIKFQDDKICASVGKNGAKFASSQSISKIIV